jgi:hypothetical protein
MSLDRGINNAFSMFYDMQRNRNAREANEIRAQQQAQANALRREELGVMRLNAATNRMNAGSSARNAASNAQNAQTAEDRLAFEKATSQWTQYKEIRGINEEAQGGYLAQLQTNGYVDAFYKPTDKFIDLINSNPDEAARIAGQASELAQPDRLPPGVRIIGADNQTRPGSLVLQTDGPAGRGAITQNATTTENDPVAELSVEGLLTTFSRDLGAIERGVFRGKDAIGRAAAFGAAKETRDRADELQELVVGNLYASASEGNAAPRAAARQLEGILNNPEISEEDRRKILVEQAEGFGIQVPEELMNPSAASDTPDAIEEVILDENTQRFVKQLDNQIAVLETRANAMTGDPTRRKRMEENLADLYGKRDEVIKESNTKAFKNVDDDLSAAQQQLETARPGRKKYWQGEVDRLTELRASAIKQGAATPTTTSDGWKQLESEVLAFIEGKTPEQIKVALETGQITLSPTAVGAMEDRLKEVGVSSLTMANKLPNDEELMLRATMAVALPDDGQRRQAQDMLFNSAAFGADSQLGVEVFKNGLERRKASSTSADDGFREANKWRSTTLTTFQNTLREGEVPIKEAAVAAGADAIIQLDRFEGNPRAQGQIYKGMNQVLSETISDIGSNGFGASLWSQLTNFFAPNTTTGLLDVDLEKVIANDPERPTAIYSMDGGRQRGQQISLGALQTSLGSELAGIIERAAVRNAKARQSS